MNSTIKWAAELSHVREVSLLGTADLSYWQNRLKDEDLTPAERDGRAQVLIIAADSKFKGIRFREVSFSILVGEAHGTPVEGAYLVRAFNSVRFFAWCERVLFSTPYSHATVSVSPAHPASVQITESSEVKFQAEMHAEPRAAIRRGDSGWQGPVFLPRGTRPAKFFIAKVHGHTLTYPFAPGQDSATPRRSSRHEVFQSLEDSHFTAAEWAIREDACHAKSKTYQADSKGFEVI